MKFVSGNVNGIRAALNKDFKKSFDSLNAEIFAIQETKCQEGQVDIKLEGYHQYFNYAIKKGYSGTAVFTKDKALNVINHMGTESQRKKDETINIIDNEGRILALEYPKFGFVCVYTPNAQNELARIEPRLKGGKRFKDFCKELESGRHGQKKEKPVIMSGDFNVAHNEIDLKNPSANRGNPGFSDEERQDFTKLLEAGFVDSFRMLYPEKRDAYSWGSYRANSRQRNVGWRIDYFLVSELTKDKIKEASIHSNIYGSDHCPISLDIAF